MIRTLSLPEIETLLGWAGDEGWNPGLRDAAAFQSADADGFLGAFVDGEMVAGISAVAYDAAFGFIGLYICRADMRGQGFSKAVWDAGIARLRGRTIGLDGVPAQLANYHARGFQPDYRTLRYSGSCASSNAHSERIAPITPDMLLAIAAFDRECFPAARSSFLHRWTSPPHIALADIGDGAIQGYGVARQCGDGFKIGPLFARSTDAATGLLVALAARCKGIVHIDVPIFQTRFIALLAESGFVAGFETTRMYHGKAPFLNAAAIFGVTSLELG